MSSLSYYHLMVRNLARSYSLIPSYYKDFEREGMVELISSFDRYERMRLGTLPFSKDIYFPLPIPHHPVCEYCEDKIIKFVAIDKRLYLSGGGVVPAYLHPFSVYVRRRTENRLSLYRHLVFSEVPLFESLDSPISDDDPTPLIETIPA